MNLGCVEPEVFFWISKPSTVSRKPFQKETPFVCFLSLSCFGVHGFVRISWPTARLCKQTPETVESKKHRFKEVVLNYFCLFLCQAPHSHVAISHWRWKIKEGQKKTRGNHRHPACFQPRASYRGGQLRQLRCVCSCCIIAKSFPTFAFTSANWMQNGSKWSISIHFRLKVSLYCENRAYFSIPWLL